MRPDRPGASHGSGQSWHATGHMITPNSGIQPQITQTSADSRTNRPEMSRTFSETSRRGRLILWKSVKSVAKRPEDEVRREPCTNLAAHLQHSIGQDRLLAPL